jgi:chromosome segregation ATPase
MMADRLLKLDDVRTQIASGAPFEAWQASELVAWIEDLQQRLAEAEDILGAQDTELSDLRQGIVSARTERDDFQQRLLRIGRERDDLRGQIQQIQRVLNPLLPR